MIIRRSLWLPPASGPSSYQVLGTAFELAVAQILAQSLGLTSIRQVGGRGDQGIDLWAKWSLPHRQETEVIIQCKRVIKKSSPSLIREMEGAILGTGKPLDDIVGILTSSMPPSEACRARLQQSRIALMYLQVREGAEGAVEGAYTSFAFQRNFPGFHTAPRRTKFGDSVLEFYYDSLKLPQITNS